MELALYDLERYAAVAARIDQLIRSIVDLLIGCYEQ